MNSPLVRELYFLYENYRQEKYDIFYERCRDYEKATEEVKSNSTFIDFMNWLSQKSKEL